MEAWKEILYHSWVALLATPIYIRQVFIIALLSLLLGFILFLALPFVVKIVVTIVTFIGRQKVRFFEWMIANKMRRVRAKGKAIPFYIEWTETLLDMITALCNHLSKLTVPKPRLKRKMMKSYVWVTVVLFFVLPFLYHTDSMEAASEKWDEFEVWMLNGESLEVHLALKAEEAKKKEEEEEKAAAESEPILLTLTDEFRDGGNIRKEPSLDGDIVGYIPHGEVFIFLYEEALDGDDRLWLKVRNEDQVEGWISSNIVKVYE